MVPVGFEPTISAGERPQTYALDRAVTGTGLLNKCHLKISKPCAGRKPNAASKTIILSGKIYFILPIKDMSSCCLYIEAPK